MSYECPEKIYKYLNVDGLIKTLEGRSIKLSRASDFNDPFDINLQDFWGMDQKDFLEGLKLSILEGMFESVPENKRIIIKEAILNTPLETMYDLPLLQERTNRRLELISRSLNVDGVFCSTTDYSNLLMWSHYADQHHGAVIEFTPSITKDSILLASRPVAYSNIRPQLYKTPDEMVKENISLSEDERIKNFLDNLIYTKSLEWSYENEYRLYVAFLMGGEKPFGLLNFYSEELTAIYLGCRMSPEIEQKVTQTAKNTNSNVKIYKMHMHAREFKLELSERK